KSQILDIACMLAVSCAPVFAAADPLDRCNVVWTTPSADSSGSMPLGNGDVGLNVWVQENGDVCFYISNSDAWDENCRLCKIGRVRISLSPNPFRASPPLSKGGQGGSESFQTAPAPPLSRGGAFTQTLRLRQGEIEIRGGNNSSRAIMRIWIDANAPVVYVDINDDFEFNAYADLELWRT